MIEHKSPARIFPLTLKRCLTRCATPPVQLRPKPDWTRIPAHLDTLHRRQPPPGNRNLLFPAGNRPENQREISAKLPKKTSQANNIYEQYQLNKPCEKNVPKNPHVGRESTRRAAYAQAPPAVRPSCPLPVESRPPATGNRKPTMRNPKLLFLPALPGTAPANPPATGRTTAHPTQNRKPKTGNRKPSAKPARNEREITEKITPFREIYPNNIKNIACEKNIPKNPRVGRESTRRAAYAQAPPAVRQSCNFSGEPSDPGTGTSNPDTLPFSRRQPRKPTTGNRNRQPFFYGFTFRGLPGDSP